MTHPGLSHLLPLKSVKHQCLKHMFKALLEISHTLISGTNLPKMGFLKMCKCIKVMQDLYFGAACTQVADSLKTLYVHLPQLMGSSRRVGCRSSETREVEETCRDLLEPSSYSLKPMTNVKQIGGDKGCKDIHCLCFLQCVLIAKSPFPLSSIPQ